MKPNFGKARLVAACAMALPALVFAIPGYGPFVPADRVRSVLLIEGIEKADTKSDNSSSYWSVKVAEGRWAAIEVKGAGVVDKAAILTLMPGGGGQPQTWDIPESAEAPVLLTGFYTAELNGDNVPDYIVTRSYLGCGLAADITQVLFLLSKSRGAYVLVSHDTYDWGPEDLVDLGGDGKLRWVETQLDQTEDDKGRPQSYWVHTLWKISGVDLVKERELARVR
jgi:hypothetical protein